MKLKVKFKIQALIMSVIGNIYFNITNIMKRELFFKIIKITSNDKNF